MTNMKLSKTEMLVTKQERVVPFVGRDWWSDWNYRGTGEETQTPIPPWFLVSTMAQEKENIPPPSIYSSGDYSAACCCLVCLVYVVSVWDRCVVVFYFVCVQKCTALPFSQKKFKDRQRNAENISCRKKHYILYFGMRCEELVQLGFFYSRKIRNLKKRPFYLGKLFCQIYCEYSDCFKAVM